MASYKHCDPLVLVGSKGRQLHFSGVVELAQAATAAAADAALVPEAGAMDAAALVALAPAQLANQLRLRAREQVAAYYDGALCSDDETLPCHTRNVCLRLAGDHKAMLPPDPRCTGHMHQTRTAAQLYTQVSGRGWLGEGSSIVGALVGRVRGLLRPTGALETGTHPTHQRATAMCAAVALLPPGGHRGSGAGCTQ